MGGGAVNPSGPASQPVLTIVSPRLLVSLAAKAPNPVAEELRAYADDISRRFVNPLLGAGSEAEFDGRLDNLLIPFIHHVMEFVPRLFQMIGTMGLDLAELLETASRTLIDQARKPNASLDRLQRHDIEWSAEVLCYGNVTLLRNVPKDELARLLQEEPALTSEQLPEDGRRYLRAHYLLVPALELLEDPPPDVNPVVTEHLCGQLYWDATFVDDIFRTLGVDWRELRDKEIGGRQRRIQAYAEGVLEGLSEEQKNEVEAAMLGQDSFFSRPASETG